ncbi:MAG: hypothetical protein N3F05_04855 [Candidatus Diapherotrites archaeon]|nr:hypothetical protein [Candidatus Diapherotrites archaeon]
MQKRPLLVKLTIVSGLFSALITFFGFLIRGATAIYFGNSGIGANYIGYLFSSAGWLHLIKELLGFLLAFLFVFGAVYLFLKMKKRALYMLIFASFAIIVRNALVLVLEPYFFTVFDLISMIPYSATLLLSLLCLGKIESQNALNKS